MSNTRFDELASKLDEKEKKNLLSQITENLDSNPIDIDDSKSRDKALDLKDIIEVEIKKISFFSGIFLRIRSFFLGKTVEEIFKNDQINGVVSRIKDKSPDLIDFRKRRFTNILVKDFLEIYSMVTPFIPHFMATWDNPLVLEELITLLFEKNNYKCKRILEDFISDREIDRIIASSGGEDEVRKKLLKSLYSYRTGFSDKIISSTESLLLDLISLRNIVLYNYAPILKLMGISSSDSYESVTDKSVAVSLIIKYIEDFYKLMIHFTGNPLSREDVELVINISMFDKDENINLLWSTYDQLTDKLKKMALAYPFDDLLKYGKDNPYYKIDFRLKGINIEEFYFSTLKKEVLEELKTKFKDRERVVVNESLDNFFGSQKITKLQNYKDYSQGKLKGGDLPYFKYIDTLNILFNFLRLFYLKTTKDILLILTKQIFSKNHVLQNRSLELSIGMDTLIEKIIKFDRSLSVDNEAGKTMRTLFTAVTVKKSNFRAYKAFISQKNDDVLEHLKKGGLLIESIIKLFDQSLLSPSDAVRLQIAAIQPSISRKKTLKDIIANEKEVLTTFLSLYNKKVNYDSID